jgi:hypothetical protein
MVRRKYVPVRMHLSTEQEDSLPVHEDSLLIPSNLHTSTPIQHQAHSPTYNILQHLPLHQNILRGEPRRSRRRPNGKQRNRTDALEKALHLAMQLPKISAQSSKRAAW